MKLNISYVISACGMMGAYTLAKAPEKLKKHHPKFTNILAEQLNKSIAQKCLNTNSDVSVLYNAYTEKQHLEYLKTYNNLGAKYIYSDSGGLQIVTAGKEINDEIKQQIYETQAYADYAMCFDVISLGSVSKTRTRNERSNVKNKIFYDSDHHQAGILTGLNIKEQVNYFRRSGAKTKVIIIVQGNNAEDMVEYYKNISSQLSDEDFEHIGGLAVADTCIGNGELESVEMLRAAKAISKICHDNVRHHLHILGVGSIYRIRPIINLIKSGYLNTFNQVSYDSSSHTCTFDYGLLKLNGTCKPLGSHRNKKAEIHFENVYDFFKEPLQNMGVEKESFVDIILGHDRDWKFSSIKKEHFAKDNIQAQLIAQSAKMMHTYFQIDNFIYNVDKLWVDSSTETEIQRLIKVRSDDDMDEWIRLNMYSKKIKTKKIIRHSEVNTLDSFFGE